MRSAIRFIAFLLLACFGSLEFSRVAAGPSSHSCMCGCGAPSEGLCGCDRSGAHSTPAQGPKPSSAPTGGCSTSSQTNTFMIAASKEVELPAKTLGSKHEPRPWPGQAAQCVSVAIPSGLRVGSAVTDAALHPWRCLQRLAWLSTFRN